jgi:hypothetical protein
VFRLVTSGTVEEGIIEVARKKLALDGQIIQAGKFDGHTTAEERESFLVSSDRFIAKTSTHKRLIHSSLQHSDRCWSVRTKRMKKTRSLMKILSMRSLPEATKNE